MAKTRILLADDHALVRAGFRALLEQQPDMEVVGEAASGEEAERMVAELQPDVVIMDLAMPGSGGLAATRRIKSQAPKVQILALTMLEDDRYFFQSIQAGASGFILKGALPVDLLTAVRTVADGQVYLYSSMCKKLVREYLEQVQPAQPSAANQGLTERERQVVCLLSQGKTGKEIANALGISAHTIERHRQNVMAKLGLHNRAELVRYAIAKGLIEAQG